MLAQLHRIEERIALGEDSSLELKAIAIPGKRVSEPDAKDVADEFAAAANASGATFVAEVVTDKNVSDISHPVNGESHPVNPENRPVNGKSCPVNAESCPVNAESCPVNSGNVFKEELEGFLLQVGLRKDFRENMVRVFLLMRAKDDVSYDGISTSLNLSRATVRNLISALKEYRLLKRIGSDKTGHWQTFFPPNKV